MKNGIKMNCGIIGVGWWGYQMSRFIKQSKKFNIKCIYDSDILRAKNISRKLKCNYTDSIKNLLSIDNITCIFIFSPNEFHPAHAIAAAEAKKHIFLEKPIANTISDSKKIVGACKKNGVVLAIGHNVRHYAIFKAAKKITDKGTIGDIIYITGNRSRPIGYVINKNSWRFYTKKCPGGPLIQMAIHILDTIRFITGLDVEQIKKISTKKFIKTENDESYAITLRANQQQLIHIFSSYITQETFYLNFFGTKGTLCADVFSGLSIQKNNKIKKVPLKYPRNIPEIEEISAFYSAITMNKPFNNPAPEDAVKNVEIIEKILKS